MREFTIYFTQDGKPIGDWLKRETVFCSSLHGAIRVAYDRADKLALKHNASVKFTVEPVYHA